MADTRMAKWLRCACVCAYVGACVRMYMSGAKLVYVINVTLNLNA